MKTVSLCITCMGRLHHLRQTLPANLEANSGIQDLEIVLLDYSSPDGLGDWVRREMMCFIEKETLVYYNILGQNLFFHSHAKNLAHRLASGTIICNVDADNFTGKGFGVFLKNAFNSDREIFIRAKGVPGTCGRIAMRKHHFMGLGGYDERMSHGWGWEDMDLIQRAKLSGLKEVTIDANTGYLSVIKHSSDERVFHSKLKDTFISHGIHKDLSIQAFQSGCYIANLNRTWGVGKVVKNFQTNLLVK